MAMIRIPANGSNNYKSGFKDISFNQFGSQFSMWNRLKLAILLVTTRRWPPKNISFENWIRKYLNEDSAHKTANSFCGWALSLTNRDVPAEEAFEIFENLYRYGGTGIPMGGCKGVTDALVEIIRSNGGKIHTNTEVSRIIVENNTAWGVIADGNKHYSDVVISNIGHPFTRDLYDSYTINNAYEEKIDNVKSSAGIKTCLAADEPLIGHNGILLTPYCRRVNGINEVTNTDPNLAPPGKHLVMAHQSVRQEKIDKLEEEIEIGLQDLKEVFPNKKYEVILTQSYYDGWPVNRASSGSDIGNTTPINSLYVVGDGAKGKGGIEVEGVALGVMNTLDIIKQQHR
jgi:phytoene dehydrogenase-like protein